MGELINGRTPDEIKACLAACPEVGCVECPYTLNFTCRDQAMQDALVLIQQLEDAQPKWISVKERLPEKDGRYLVAAVNEKSTTIEINDYDDGEWSVDLHFISETTTADVTHWMPLPNPPKKEDADE